MKVEVEDWLAWRRQGVGASDIPAILGCGPKTMADVLAEKLGGTVPENAAMARGKRLEAEAITAAEDVLGPLGQHQTCWESETIPGLQCTLDAMDRDGHPVEIKVPSLEKWHETASGLPPVEYGWQVLAQCLCVGADYGYIAVYHPSLGVAVDVLSVTRQAEDRISWAVKWMLVSMNKGRLVAPLMMEDIVDELTQAMDRYTALEKRIAELRRELRDHMVAADIPRFQTDALSVSLGKQGLNVKRRKKA